MQVSQHNFDTLNVQENIKRIRVLKGIAQKEVCVSANIPQSVLSRIESGGDFQWSKLVRIAEALDVSIMEIVGFDSKVVFNQHGVKSKGVVINQAVDKQCQEVVKLLKEENAFLRKLLEKSIGKKQTHKSKP